MLHPRFAVADGASDPDAARVCVSHYDDAVSAVGLASGTVETVSTPARPFEPLVVSRAKPGA